MKIKIIDSIMGSGKTEWAIQYMNENPDKKFMYITPFNDEIQTRIIPKCPALSFKFAREGHKISDFKEMLRKGQNVVATHECFTRADSEVEALLGINNYILIMDEVLNVIIDLQCTMSDARNILKNYGHVEDGFLVWEDEKYNGTLNKIKEIVQTGNVIMLQDSVLIWQFPVRIFEKFKEVYIMTYLFPGQIQKYYFDLYDIDYSYYKIALLEPNHYTLIPHDGSINSNLKPLINIYEGNLNDIGKTDSALSWSWYMNCINKPKLKELKNNLKNYFQHIVNVKSREILWTCFKGEFVKKINDFTIMSQVKGNGYTKGFIAHNARATNKFKGRTCVAYCVNKRMRPIIRNTYFAAKGIKVDENLYSLSEMLQFIWRSAIRDGRKIDLYIPSKRMRKLLIDYLDNKTIVDYNITENFGDETSQSF